MAAFSHELGNGQKSSKCYEREIAELKQQRDDLLAVCEELMKEADDGSARFDDPEPDSVFIKAKQVIANAKK